jgi:GNAT superfamily N-acetyltransferase
MLLPPTLLTDLSRLPEIYALRVTAWEQSPGQHYVNRTLFPQGWHDALDIHPGARHWAVKDEADHFVAAARLVLLNDLAECDQADIMRFALPPGRPFGYLSRLVIALPYRKQGLAQALDEARTHYLRYSGAVFGVVAPILQRVDTLATLGWTLIGNMCYHSGGNSPKQSPGPVCLWQP